ncbi:MAG TPA: hypothetical protein VMB49_07600 [Acidobacteriaceae bacterium]|nr:hypothetical protein [Acidobacteriaceae bacterium]
MESVPASRVARKHTNGWMTVLALGLLALALIACLYVLIGFPAEAQTSNGSAVETSPTPAYSATTPAQTYRRQPPASYSAPVVSPSSAAVVGTPAVRSDPASTELQEDLNTVRDELRQSQENLQQAARMQSRIRTASALFLAVFAFVAALIVMQVYRQAKAWDQDAQREVEQVESVSSQLGVLRDAKEEARQALPALLQEVGEQPLIYQEEGAAFTPRAQIIIDEVDALAYVGSGRLAFQDLSAEPEAAVYLNGLLLSAVSHLSRSDAWTAFSRLDQFFSQLARFPNAVERRRIAQAYSYRALAGYQVLESQDREPSWLRKADRTQLENLSRQAFADVAHASTVDPDWKHTTFVEAMLCSRFYVPDGVSDNGSRSDLFVRGLRRAVSLYKSLIDERSYRGPSRRNLVRCLKRIAEQTGEKGDFSDFGYALNAFPTDEELADEALAARQPNSQDRFLWQWLLGDEELFGNVERLNLAEYRAFWIRMLDTKVHLRNWRADLAELQQCRPEMKDWTIQLLQSDQPPITLSNAISRRQERFETPASGA